MEPPKNSFILRLLSKYDYPTKFIFISLLFAFSIIVSNYFLIFSQHEKILFAQKELLGVRYEYSIRQLLELVIKHQAISTQASSETPSFNSDLSNLRQQIGTAFTNLKVLDGEIGGELKTSANEFQMREKSYLRPSEIEAQWNELIRRGMELNSTDSTAAHLRILNDLVGLISYVSDTSNLYLDPYTDSTYLSDVNFMIIPNIAVLIPKVTQQINTVSHDAQGTLSLEDRFNITSSLAILESYRDRARNSLEKVFVEETFSNNPHEAETRIKEPLNQFLSSLNDFIFSVKKNYLLTDKIQDKQSEVTSLGFKTTALGFSLWDVVNEQLTRIFEHRIHRYRVGMLSVVLLSLCCGIIAFSLGFLVMKEISRPLLQLLTGAKQLAAGDLSARIPVLFHDEVGQVGLAFNQMVDALHELIGKLQWTGIQLTTSTTEISAAAKEQEATIVEQEATTKQIAVTAREISATAKDFALMTSNISRTAEQTSELASMVKSGLGKMESIMTQMVEASSNIASKLAILNDKAGNITTVITTITKVADQTNLLSLNAAIEAEKAGEHGRSFAVIAREIRRLADQTNNATTDIEKMVNEIVSAVSAGVMGVDKFSEEIHSGVNQVSVISDQLGKIIEQVQDVTESFESVNQGMQTHRNGAERINESITQLSSTAQQTTTSIRQFHNAIDQLNNAAQEMQTAVSKIKR